MVVDDCGCGAYAASPAVCLLNEDSCLGHPQRKKLLEWAEHGVPGTIIIGQVQFCSALWQERGHKNHKTVLLPPCHQMHRTAPDRQINDQDRPGTVQILLVEIALPISEHFPAGFQQQPFRLRLNRLDHIPLRLLCNLERLRLNLYASDCSFHRSSSPFGGTVPMACVKRETR